MFQELLRVLDKVARKHDVGIANVATAHVLEQPAVAAVILGARNARHLEHNQAVFDVRFDEEDRVLLGEVLQRSRGPRGDTFSLERVKDGPHAAIMKTNLN